MKTVFVVFWKEVIENLRDRRTVVNSLLTAPLVGPLLFCLFASYIISHELERGEQTLEVPVIGAENAPNLVQFLRQSGVVVKPAVDEPEAAIAARDVDMVLRVPPGYGEAWKAGRTAQVELLYDSSQRDSETLVARLRLTLGRYSAQNTAMRLVARGIAPTVANPVAVSERDQSTPQSRGSLLFGMLPYFLILSGFLGGMYLAIDTTAGERERQSLEPLFANPVTRTTILTGKLLATFVFAMGSLVLSLVALIFAARLIPMAKIGMVLHIGPMFMLTTLVAMVPLVLLASCLQTMIAAFAKSFREAQTYLQLLTMIPALPSLALAVSPVKAQSWMYAVPLLGQHLTITQLVRAEAVTPVQLALCLASGLLVALVAWAVAARVYGAERLGISA